MADIPEACTPLYRQALGADFDRLPEVLRQFHCVPAGGSAGGMFRVTRGAGPIRDLVASSMRLPPASAAVPVRLQVAAAAGRERWTRDFGAHRLVTEQWMRGELLIEAAGPIRFGFRLSASDGRMLFRMERCWLGAVPIPMFAAPRVSAWVIGEDCAWQIMVQVDVPVLGMIVRYEGELTTDNQQLGTRNQEPSAGCGVPPC